MQRITPLLLSAAVMSISALAGCHNDDHPSHHARSPDTSGTYYDRSQTAGDRVYHDSTTSTPRSGDDLSGSHRIDGRSPTDSDSGTHGATPPIDNGAGRTNEPGLTPTQPGTFGTRAPTQSANPQPNVSTPHDATETTGRSGE